MGTLDEILAKPTAGKPARPVGSDVRGYQVSNTEGGTPTAAMGGVTTLPGNVMRAGEVAPYAEKGAKVSDISGGESEGGGREDDAAPRDMTWTELYELMNPHKPESDEEKAKREKREKGEAVLAALGDGISALSNLWFTSKYAPHSYDASKGMSAATKARWEKVRAQREANDRAYYEGWAKAKAKDEAKERDDRNWRHTLEREKKQEERQRLKDERDARLGALNEQLKQKQISAAEWKAEQERVKAMFAAENQRLDMSYKQAGIRQRDAAAGASKASATASYARAGSYTGGGGSGGKVAHTFMGKKYKSDKDYVKDVTEAARQYNKRHKGEEGFESISTYGRKAEEFAGEVETRLREEKDQGAQAQAQAPTPAKGSEQTKGSKQKWNNTSNINW